MGTYPHSLSGPFRSYYDFSSLPSSDSLYKRRIKNLGRWKKLPVPDIDDAGSPEIHFGKKDYNILVKLFLKAAVQHCC